jgi:2-polyprenyl-6-methoxyphenol hydroxylase-like FAD-dependent oxidoreductase
MNPRKHQGRAVVIGASMGGLFAARVLSERFDSVVVLERDDLENTVDGRRGVPQGRHAHALLQAGLHLIEEWFPGITEELIDGGAEPGDPGCDIHWFQGGGTQIHYTTGIRAPVCSRPFLEEAVRNRVEKIENVELRTGVHVEGLTTTADKQRVNGVTLDDGTTIDAGLVLDCTGRSGLSLKWVEALGFAPPRVVEVGIDMRYTTRVYERTPDPARDFKLALIIGPNEDPILAACFPMERDRWMITLCGYHGDYAPSDDDGFLAYARRLPSPVIADLIEASKPISDYRTHRLPSNQRRLVEKMKTVPAGWALLGDAVASFNPVYGQGMSSSALQAEALGRSLDGYATIDAEMTRRIHKGAAKAVTNPWMLSTGGDFAHPKTTGKRPPGTKLLNRYAARVAVATHHDVAVAKAFSAVGNLVAAPTSLMTPKIAWRVLRGGKRR